MRGVRVDAAKKFIIDALLWCALAALLAACIINQSAVRQYSVISLRFSAPISGQAAYAARQYSISRSEESPFWPTFWKEYSASFESAFVTASASCIAYSGDAQLVWPAAYIKGAAPGVTDSAGCAVSETLARRLWGSADVIGMTILADGESRVVRGVFQGGDELALISHHAEDRTQSWSAACLTGGPDGAVRDDVMNYANAAGLGRPDSILMGGTSPVSGVMTMLPLLILAVYGLSLIISLVKKHFPLARKPLFFIVLIAFAVALPLILGALPAWSVPTRWSDFSFWASLIERASGGMREFLQAAPMLRDVELRMLMLKQTGIAFLSVCCSLSVCFRWHMRRERRPGPASPPRRFMPPVFE